MSETPICDKHKYETDLGAEVVPLEIAQKLERMLKNAEIAAETYRLEAQKAKSEQSAEMLKSERAANAMLTEELDMFLAEQQAMGEIIESKDRQLAEALGEIKGLRQLVNDCHIIAGQLETERNEARAEIERLKCCTNCGSRLYAATGNGDCKNCKDFSAWTSQGEAAKTAEGGDGT